MEPTAVDLDELVEFWTVLDEDRALLAGKRGLGRCVGLPDRVRVVGLGYAPT